MTASSEIANLEGRSRFTVNEDNLAVMSGWDDYSPEGNPQDTHDLLLGAWRYGVLVDTVAPALVRDYGEPEPRLIWEYLPSEIIFGVSQYYRWLLDTGHNDFLIASHPEPIRVLGRAHKDHDRAAFNSSVRRGLEAAWDVIREAAAEGNLLAAQFACYHGGERTATLDDGGFPRQGAGQ